MRKIHQSGTAMKRKENINKEADGLKSISASAAYLWGLYFFDVFEVGKF